METTRDAFQSLSLSIPVDVSKYQYICQFLERVLSLKDEKVILGEDNENVSYPTKFGYVELLPNVSFPLDAWVNDQLVVRDIKIKNSVLNEITALMERELGNIKAGNQVKIETNVINYYEKLLVAYKFLEAPVILNPSPPTSTVYRNTDFPLREEDDEDPHDHHISRTILNQLSQNSLLKTYHSLFGNGSNTSTHSSNHNSMSNSGTGNNGPYATTITLNGNGNGNGNINSNNGNSSNNNAGSRLTFSRRKRFLTILGQAGTSDSNINEMNGSGNGAGAGAGTGAGAGAGISTNGSISGSPNPNNGGFDNDNDESKSKHNSLLTKSRLYNKLKKNRELSASQTSLISNPTSLAHSNRNSITTTMTTGSKRRGSIQTPEGYNDQRSSVIFGGSGGSGSGGNPNGSGSGMNGFSSSRHSSIYSITGLTPSQRQDIQKSKYEYYVQLKKLLRLTKQVLKIINDSIETRDLITLVDFIKRYVMKFVVIDMNEILLEYIEFKEVSLYRK